MAVTKQPLRLTPRASPHILLLSPMLQKTTLPISRIRVPVKRAKTLDPARVEALARSILDEGQLTPISVRADGENFVLVEGLHRLEALKALGEEEVQGYLVQVRLH